MFSRSELFSFPDPVNENAARTVAAGVVAMTATYVATGWLPLLAVIVYGFWARVLTGPTLSPLGRIATQVVAPRLAARGVSETFSPGPPKRFAQAIGAALSTLGLVLHLSGSVTAATVAVAMITGAAFLESAFAYCLGCTIFGYAMRIGLVSESVCEACSDLSKRPGFTAIR